MPSGPEQTAAGIARPPKRRRHENDAPSLIDIEADEGRYGSTPPLSVDGTFITCDHPPTFNLDTGWSTPIGPRERVNATPHDASTGSYNGVPRERHYRNYKDEVRKELQEVKRLLRAMITTVEIMAEEILLLKSAQRQIPSAQDIDHSGPQPKAVNAAPQRLEDVDERPPIDLLSDRPATETLIVEAKPLKQNKRNVKLESFAGNGASLEAFRAKFEEHSRYFQ